MNAWMHEMHKVPGLFIPLIVTNCAMREIIGSSTLFANASLLLGNAFALMELTLTSNYGGFLLMILPPGALIALGFFLAGKRIIDAHLSRREEAPLPAATTTSAESGTGRRQHRAGLH